MAADGVNITEDAEMVECDEEKVVTMMDVLQEQQDFEEDANAVLGASDDKNCTYVKGYIKRQALYACLTCCPDAKTDPTKRAGVCLACSLNCHENHELIELYTKRNFRCDCGNPKFNSHPCQFTPSKPTLNDDNIYNQNFSGLYCICQRPYPDPEETFEDDMIQCIICEDWLHASHLDTVVPANDQYSEMICKSCMEKNEFLHDYSNFAVNVESGDVDILTINSHKSDTICNGDIAKKVVSNGAVESEKDDAEMIENKEKASQQNDEKSDKECATTDKEEKYMNLDAESEKEQKSEDATKDEESVTTVANENIEVNITPKSEGTGLEDKTDNATNKTDAPSETSETEQKDYQSTNNVKTDGNVDANKTEDQLLDDIRALTSDNKTDGLLKLTSEEATEPSKHKENSVENSKVEEANNKKIEESSEEDKTNENLATTDGNSVSETTSIEVPNSMQKKEKDIENSDEKTDAVMDAIDALLKDPAETNDSEDSKQNSEKMPASDENTDSSTTQTEIKDKQNKEVHGNADSTDIEMAENKSQDESPSDNKVETKTLIDSEKTGNTELTHSTNENTDIKKENGDITNASKTFDETENSNKSEDNTSKNKPSPDIHNILTDTVKTISENKRKLSTEVEETSPKKVKLDISKCIRPKGVKSIYKGATFWPSNFRQKLCTCGECISMYKELHVLFLSDPEDTVSAYESLGKENIDGGVSQYEKGLQALSSLDRIQQINALTEYNRMRDKLLEFLKSFRDRKEIVREEDIKAFFAGMKPKREPDGVYFCR